MSPNSYTFRIGETGLWESLDNHYFNSRLDGGDGRTAGIVLADDFGPQAGNTLWHASNRRRLGDGDWYTQNGSNWSTTPSSSLYTYGWQNLTEHDPITPTGAVVDLGAAPGFSHSQWVASTGLITGTDRNNAAHDLYGAGSGGYTEIWVRTYTKPLAGYIFRPEKLFTFNRFGDSAGIHWAGAGWNVGGLEQSTTGRLEIVTVWEGANGGSVRQQNQGNTLNMTQDGHWYYVEWHLKLNTTGNADGVIELWLDDVGEDGDEFPGSPTLRMHHDDVNFGYGGDQGTDAFGNLWLECWAPSIGGNVGTRYWGEPMVSIPSYGQIGFGSKAAA